MMIFDDELIGVLKNFNTINNSIAFVEGEPLATMAPSKTMLAVYQRNADHTFGLYDISRFIGALSMFENPSINFDDHGVVKVSSGSLSLRYALAEPTICTPVGDLEQLKKVTATAVQVDPSVSFNVSAGTWKTLIKAVSLLSLPEFAITGINGEIVLSAVDTKNPSADNWSAVVGATSANFKVVHKAENLKFIDGDYDVVIGPKGVTKLTHTIKPLTYIILPQVKSSVVGELS